LQFTGFWLTCAELESGEKSHPGRCASGRSSLRASGGVVWEDGTDRCRKSYAD